MTFNIFEGARRIALLIAGVAVVGTLITLFTYDPYISVHYSIAHPKGEFVRLRDRCPSDADQHYVTTGISTGESVSVTLCLLAMSFGKDETRLIPYKSDENNMLWGAAKYSNEVSEYKQKLGAKFKIPSGDEDALRNEFSRDYWENWKSGLSYLVRGLVIFAGSVLAIGWIVRGFLGIPRGMDRRPQ